MSDTEPSPSGLAREEPELSAEDDIPTADEAEPTDDTIASDRDKPSRE